MICTTEGKEMNEEMAVAEALAMVARAIHALGNADAATPMGGLEALGAVIKEGDERIVDAIGELASAVREVADALTDK